MGEWKVGRCFYESYVLSVCCNENERFDDKMNCECLKLVFLKQGTIILALNENKRVFTAPCLLCLNHQDQVALISQNAFVADCMYFLPEVLNNDLNLINIFENEELGAHITSSHQDKYFFTPFMERTATYVGGINIDILMMQVLSQKFMKLKNELSEERDSTWPCRCRSIFIEILIILQEKYSSYLAEASDITFDQDITQIREILDFLHTNYMNKITIKELTLKFHVNRNTLNECFLKLTKQTPIAYLINYRLKIAEKMVTNTAIPIYEICERVGFGEQVNFIRSFKKHYGESPTSFRKKYGLIK